jgi:hypothetical protein
MWRPHSETTVLRGNKSRQPPRGWGQTLPRFPLPVAIDNFRLALRIDVKFEVCDIGRLMEIGAADVP